MHVSRRRFLKSSTAVGATLAAPAVLRADNDATYRIALVGCGWWGGNILHYAMETGDVEVVGLCDVDRRHLKEKEKQVKEGTGDTPALYGDYRRLLEEQEPDIVICATPDHWHPLVTIDAVEAGAHVYVEKPVSHTIKEGRAMVEAARRNNRKVQVGTHRRVSPHNKWAIKFMQDGKMGDIGMVRIFVHSSGHGWQSAPNQEPPEELDWDMWCGPAPKQPFNPKIHPKGFRQFLDYANGTLGDWGIHWTDHITWWSDEKYPHTVSSIGGRHLRDDNTTGPDTQTVQWEFDSFSAVWEHRHYAGNRSEKARLGAYFYGEEGIMHIGWLDGATFYPRQGNQDPIHKEPQLRGDDKHNIPGLWADLVDSIEKDRRPVCDIEVGHLSTNLSLLGMLSLKLGRGIEWDGEREVCLDDPEANELLRREYRDPWEYPEV